MSVKIPEISENVCQTRKRKKAKNLWRVNRLRVLFQFYCHVPQENPKKQKKCKKIIWLWKICFQDFECNFNFFSIQLCNESASFIFSSFFRLNNALLLNPLVYEEYGSVLHFLVLQMYVKQNHLERYWYLLIWLFALLNSTRLLLTLSVG